MVFPPFPPLTRTEYCWEGTVKLQAWAGFLVRQGPYASASSSRPSDGTVQVNVSFDERPSAEQTAAFEHLLAHQHEVRDDILRAVIETYPVQQELYGYEDEAAAALMPDLDSPQDLKPLVGLSSVHVLRENKQGLAYIGFEFGCTWDNEHGVGAMTHKGRVITTGGADVSFLEWVAERDIRGSEESE